MTVCRARFQVDSATEKSKLSSREKMFLTFVYRYLNPDVLDECVIAVIVSHELHLVFA